MAKWSWQGMTQEQQEEITKLRGNMAYIGGLCRGTQDAIDSGLNPDFKVLLERILKIITDTLEDKQDGKH